MTKFKVGDRVKVINANFMKKQNNIKDYFKYNNSIQEIIKDDRILGRRYSLNNVVVNNDKTNHWLFLEEELKLVQPKTFTKSDLKDRYVVKTKEGYEYIVDLKGDKILRLENGVQKDSYLRLDSYYNDLTHKYGKNWDIIEIYKPEYKTIWTRPEEVKPEPKELTVDEISDLLGYEIKIVGGEK